MSGFNDRERAEESKSAHEAELTFKATARRNRLLGQWVAAEFLALEGEAADAFAKEVVTSDFDKPGDDDVVEFVLKRVADVGGDLSEVRLRHKMAELLRIALDQVRSET